MVVQTRYDILFEVCNLASNVNTSCKDCASMKVFIRDDRLVFRKIIDHHAPLIYRTLPAAEGNRYPQLIVFPDAGYASLRDAASVESCVMIYGAPTKRNGPITCAGNIVSFGTRKITRICRSPAHAEGVAMANAADLTIYTQCILSEILYQQRDFLSLPQSDGLPLMSPFKIAPKAQDIKQEQMVRRNASSLRASVLFFDSQKSISATQTSCLMCANTARIHFDHCTYFIIACYRIQIRCLRGPLRMH